MTAADLPVLIVIVPLFGGLLSGTMYGYFGPKGINRPGIMWALFGLLGVGSALGLWFYNRWVSGLDKAEKEEPGDS